jgi:hypothetical protein
MQGGENNVPDELTSNGRKSLSGLFYCNIANNLVRTSLHALLAAKVAILLNFHYNSGIQAQHRAAGHGFCLLTPI